MMSLIIGVVTVGLSVWGLVAWRAEFFFLLKGLLPVCFLMGGLMAVVAGIASFGGKRAAAPDDKAAGEKK